MQESMLDPATAAKIAGNCYFTLRGWGDNLKPIAGLADKNFINEMVLGRGKESLGHKESDNFRSMSLGDKHPGESTKIIDSFHARTGFNTKSGFGYVMSYVDGRQSKHVVVATRGTRPELDGKADVFSDLNIAYKPFGDVGLVHAGFLNVSSSILSQLTGSNIEREILSADYVHFVGHSLGGAVATILATHYARARGSNGVKLYTFGSPRVGVLSAHLAIENLIGQTNVSRIAHDLDPITMIAPYPYRHVNYCSQYSNFMTLPSPVRESISMNNHDISEYISTVANFSWQELPTFAVATDFNSKRLADKILNVGSSSSWIVTGSSYVLAIIFKVLDYVIKSLGVVFSVVLTPIDMICEVLYSIKDMAVSLGGMIVTLIEFLAKWAGVQFSKGASIVSSVLRAIASRMLSVIAVEADLAIARSAENVRPSALHTLMKSGDRLKQIVEI